MTKEQFKEFVTKVVTSYDPDATRDEPWKGRVAQIVAQWESDVNDARIAGQDEGVQSDFGTLNTFNGQY